MNDARHGRLESERPTAWWRPWARVALLGLGAAVWLATSPARVQYLAFPSWVLSVERQPALGCAVLTLDVASSGKEGLGLKVMATTDEAAGCEVRLTSAVLQVEAVAIKGDATPGTLSLRQRAPQFMYVVFAFDNEAAWNAGHRRARLTMSWEIAGVAMPPREVWLEHRIDESTDDAGKRPP